VRRYVPRPLVGAASCVLALANTCFWATPILVLAALKLLMPTVRARQWVRRIAIGCGEAWVVCNNVIMMLGGRTRWHITGIDGLSRHRSYFVCANHQAWSDILVLQRTLVYRVPFLMFFIKQELVWVPILGVVWKGLDFPFMKRYSRDYLKKHPEHAGKDLEATRRMCAKLRGTPVAITSFLEGTRFSAAKHARQRSPYNHLLKPKAGGIGFVMNAMGDQLDSMLDVTIVYSGDAPTMWQFLCGSVDLITVHVAEREIPADLCNGDYSRDADLRARTQAWTRRVWRDKDQLLDRTIPLA
jgi:1-acyl-sn-glycerol-3-phosphate acyltransferase